MRRIWIGLLLGTLFTVGCDRGSHPGNIDKPAPQFVLSDGTRTVDLAKLRGRVVVLNLWASWCAPCIEELPSLLALQKQMPEIEIVAVSMDQDPDVYRRFLVEHHVDLLTVRDQEHIVKALYFTVKIPETYIID
ncbi:MAG: TlpA family protein disulfide reductase [Edaphobacter sp.]